MVREQEGAARTTRQLLKEEPGKRERERERGPPMATAKRQTRSLSLKALSTRGEAIGVK
jgi:hypothetical protein